MYKTFKGVSFSKAIEQFQAGKSVFHIYQFVIVLKECREHVEDIKFQLRATPNGSQLTIRTVLVIAGAPMSLPGSGQDEGPIMQIPVCPSSLFRYSGVPNSTQPPPSLLVAIATVGGDRF